MKNFIDAGSGLHEHKIGNKHCDEGWCEGTTRRYPLYPAPCVCGGLIHADFGDENSEGSYWLYEKCDKCGDKYRKVCE